MTSTADISIVHLFCPSCREDYLTGEIPQDYDCFDDGCEFECCGCGVCTQPSKCSATGKGYVWHK